MIVEINTQRKSLSDPIKEDFKEMAKDSQCKEEEETSKATEVCIIYIFFALFALEGLFPEILNKNCQKTVVLIKTL